MSVKISAIGLELEADGQWWIKLAREHGEDSNYKDGIRELGVAVTKARQLAHDLGLPFRPPHGFVEYFIVEYGDECQLGEVFVTRREATNAGEATGHEYQIEQLYGIGR